MTFKDVKRIRKNPTWDDVDNDELAKMIDLAIEKQIPKKPGERTLCKILDFDMGSCPNCHYDVLEEIKYCSHCGQALDWSGEE